jgi:hypothetical protein
MKNSNTILPGVRTDEEYEKLKLDNELFKKAALKIVTQHHLPNESLSPFEGTLLEDLWETLDQSNKIIIIRELGLLIREVHSIPTAYLPITIKTPSAGGRLQNY